jgi:ElaB/YqjD/DUF883 family membrane-anchored ribosome-binding protein
MSNDPSPLKYMGTQSHETMAMEAAMADRAIRSAEQATDQTLGKLADKIDAASSDLAAEGTKISDATNWAIGKAKDTLRSATGYVRERATTVLETYTKKDPVRAILIAASTGAVLMGLVAMMARSGARTVRRNVQR